ncbi:hypothetical protein BOTBODRAFT_174716 [Botryobasidium botryosum FD-172 SS1]|uniref:FAD-binding PCMH-type domain-containing protein n=1 Tax=Botryobasidium botryosum (strain FD-172 SS1) TaxID=930990 RepID=A0A067MRN2_BOTB1|nr:hypothetical protein BOTBODRAFT_174716 [Botryobasidium botryosum FD-172 SS1]
MNIHRILLISTAFLFAPREVTGSILNRNSKLCTSSDSCWPDSPAWIQLNASVSGHLVRSLPAAAPCHDPYYDADACAIASKSWGDSIWRSNQPGGYQDTAWENGDEPCYIDQPRNVTCQQGLVPIYTVAAESVQDIREAVKFAAKYHLRTRIKGAAHEFLGRSSGEGSFGIQTIKLKGITFNDTFVPDGCDATSQATVTVGAGEHFYDLNKQCDARRVVAVTGTSNTVGAAGGWLLGGGHSSLSPLYGLGVDNVLEFKVVTSDGQVRIANECQNPDLFWALRGGGSGFAVTTSATYKTHPYITSVLGLHMVINTTSDIYPTFLKTYAMLQPTLSDKGFSGYTSSSAPTTSMDLLQYNSDGNITKANMTFAPLFDLAAKNPDKMQISTLFGIVPSYFSIFPNSTEEGGAPLIIGSRLFPRSMFESEEQSEALARFFAQNNLNTTWHLVGGGKVNEPSPSDMGLNPSWRNALHHILIADSWESDTPIPERNAKRKRLTDNVQKMAAALVPNMGSYVNEADRGEPNWQTTFWGDNYARLLDIKMKYDPTGVLTCEKCVGYDVFGS